MNILHSRHYHSIIRQDFIDWIWLDILVAVKSMSGLTLMNALAFVSRPSVVCLDASEPSGTMSFSFSRQYLRWALLQDKGMVRRQLLRFQNWVIFFSSFTLLSWLKRCNNVYSNVSTAFNQGVLVVIVGLKWTSLTQLCYVIRIESTAVNTLYLRVHATDVGSVDKIHGFSVSIYAWCDLFTWTTPSSSYP